MILVTGGNGQVGSELNALSNSSKFEFTFTDYEELDITNMGQVFDFFEKNAISYVINCAAYTAVDKAEDEVEKAHAINVTGTENLAKACAKSSIPLIHLSTDYVYHSNTQNIPFKEDDYTMPQGIYAATKLEGELIARTIHSMTMVIRTSWVYSSFGNNFVKTMIRLGTERNELGIIYDQIGSPTYAADLAKAILEILEQHNDNKIDTFKFNEIYHYSNEGVCSWYDFAKAIFEIKNIECKVNPIETKDYPTPAKRPHFSLLNKAKIKNSFGLNIPYWKDSLRKCIDLLEA